MGSAEALEKQFYSLSLISSPGSTLFFDGSPCALQDGG